MAAVVLLAACCALLGLTSAKMVRRSAIEMEWFEPSENTIEADYYDQAAGMAHMNPAETRALRPGHSTKTHSCNHIRGVPQELRSSQHMKPSGLANFYQKYTEAYGIPIVASNNVSDDAMKRACYVARFLFADNSKVRQSYYERSGRIGVIGRFERTTSIPEHSFLSDYYDTRARGLGATDYAPICTCGEENILCYPEDRWYEEDIMLHELAHGVSNLGAVYGIKRWSEQLFHAYISAWVTGKWAYTYAMTNKDEYFAEGCQSFFNCEAYYDPPNGIHNSINTQAKLINYDPPLVWLLSHVFPCNNTYLKRCLHSREQEMQQNLRMDCDLNEPNFNTLPPVPCQDLHSHCDEWAANGDCNRETWYMPLFCRRTCNKC